MGTKNMSKAGDQVFLIPQTPVVPPSRDRLASGRGQSEHSYCEEADMLQVKEGRLRRLRKVILALRL